jgi:hypothetical protein
MMNACLHRVWRKLQQRERKCNKRRFVGPNVSHCCISDALWVPTVKPWPCVADAPQSMKKCYTLERGNVRDRLDIRAASRTNNMIEDAAQAPLSVAR